jgi:hypothetical protein
MNHEAIEIEERGTDFTTSITGPDGAYVAKLLVAKDCEVHAAKRRCSFNTKRVEVSFETAGYPLMPTSSTGCACWKRSASSD